jgi:hypothetical protein
MVVAATGNREGYQMTKTYYTLLSRETPKDRWVIEFGDYSRSVVRQERDDMKDGAFCDHAFKIIATGDAQSAIDAAVAALNG